MEEHPLTYFEKLEKIYVLTETGQMLQEQLNELQNNNEPYDHVEEDLNKIHEEIHYYTDGEPIENLDFSNVSLINPALYSSFDD